MATTVSMTSGSMTPSMRSGPLSMLLWGTRPHPGTATVVSNTTAACTSLQATMETTAAISTSTVSPSASGPSWLSRGSCPRRGTAPQLLPTRTGCWLLEATTVPSTSTTSTSSTLTAWSGVLWKPQVRCHHPPRGIRTLQSYAATPCTSLGVALEAPGTTSSPLVSRLTSGMKSGQPQVLGKRPMLPAQGFAIRATCTATRSSSLVATTGNNG
mmetsp:Transcript_71540/g.165435  ORF Transcript_71540/g.165435 Transcript_71540/m.165435 type:complete len:213 (-) Transcript_71540:930-1568(-)